MFFTSVPLDGFYLQIKWIVLRRYLPFQGYRSQGYTWRPLGIKGMLPFHIAFIVIEINLITSSTTVSEILEASILPLFTIATEFPDLATLVRHPKKGLSHPYQLLC